MNVTFLVQDSSQITVGCNCAYIINNDNTLSMTFDNDVMAREAEEIIKRNNIKTKHTDSEITVLDISNYNLFIN
jgi:hypothetical protein